MKELIKNTDPHTKEVLYVFEDEKTGQMISNPLWNPEMTEHVSPERYGFYISGTGGGCTAHCQYFLLDGKKVVMLITNGDLCHIDEDSVMGTVGLFDEEWDELPGQLYWEVTR
jgi:hypothetical protein